MEPLEIRCNLTVIDPLASALAEPVVEVPCDIVETGFHAPIHDSAYGGGTNVELSLKVTDTDSGNATPPTTFNISSFAGQTVRILIESADAATASQAAGGAGNDVLLGGAGTDYERSDDNNHGTHVAGTIGAVGNNGVGMTDNGELDIASDSDGDDSTEAFRAGYAGWVRISPEA